VHSSDNDQDKFFSTLVTGFVVSFTVIFGMLFLIASYVIFLIKERASGAKHLQKVSGVGSGAFWFSNFLSRKIYPGHCQMNTLVKGGSLLLLND
jgi:ATP-binding cassette subfamily A (ABC1) protein 3